MLIKREEQSNKSKSSEVLPEASKALCLLDEKAEGKEPSARANLMPESQAPSPILGACPVLAGSGWARGMLGLQLPGEVITSALWLHSQSFLYETHLSGS